MISGLSLSKRYRVPLFYVFFTSHASLSLSVAGWTCVKILQAWDGIEEGKNQIILQRETLGIIYGDRLKVGRNL